MTSMTRGSPKVGFFDFLTVLVSFFLIIALLESPSTPSIHTYGIVAITTSWQTQDDVDLYVRNPRGVIIYFASPSGGLMYLEHDTIPLTTDASDGHKTAVQGEHERAVITGAIPGEYTVNVMMFNKVSTRPCVVTVQVWMLQGQDHVLLTTTVVLRYGGQERTAFRIRLNASGQIVGVSHVQSNVAQSTLGGGPQISSSGRPIP